ncbi:hypothetical protein V3C99_004781 [Haemonchus contortus]
MKQGIRSFVENKRRMKMSSMKQLVDTLNWIAS